MATWAAGRMQASASRGEEAAAKQHPLPGQYVQEATRWLIQVGGHVSEASDAAMDAREAFTRIDSGGDGTLSQQEFVPQPRSPEEGAYDLCLVAEAVRLMCANHDGRVGSWSGWSMGAVVAQLGCRA